ncbi:MAG: alpha/beta hydrolase [Spirochaetales bacterium]|nr:alpha/beta hydrolase [Spirochaetales bacterium]
MKNIFYVLILLSIIFTNSCTHTKKELTENSNENNVTPKNNQVEEFFDLDINGSKQRVLIQSNNVEDNPILLYLHGGPGSSAMMYAYLYSDRIKDNFIFVNWDMRGAALSLHDDTNPELVSEGQIAEDAVNLIHYLLDKYNKKKIYLIGHSFGSVLGMYLVDNYPDLFSAYIGIGQVISYRESVPVIYEWLHKTLVDAGDQEALARIEKDHFPYFDIVKKYGGHHRLSLDLNSLLMGSPYYFDGYLDLLDKGRRFSMINVGKNPSTFGTPSDMTQTTVPLYFFEGRNDHVVACAPELVVKYCETVDAPVKKIVWFENSAHMLNVEEPEKFQSEVINVLNETQNNFSD